MFNIVHAYMAATCVNC